VADKESRTLRIIHASGFTNTHASKLVQECGSAGVEVCMGAYRCIDAWVHGCRYCFLLTSDVEVVELERHYTNAR
jgi:hypothetical protein